MANPILQLDIAIIGGGIAGLWALNHLRNVGYSAVLFEHRSLGGEQTAASQGIVHSGIKYHLADGLNNHSDMLPTMPGAWRDCLAGRGAVDLRACRVLSDELFLWSNSAFTPPVRFSRAGKPMLDSVTEIAPDEFPAPLQSADFHGPVYRVDELVVDIPSLVATLVAQQRDAIFRIDWRHAALQRMEGRACLQLPHCTVAPQRFLLAAGAGNAALIAQLGGAAPAMQRLPLQQVLVKHQYEPSFFAHYVGSKSSPRLTVSSHRTAAGEPLWALGGDLATEGAHRTPAEQTALAQRELAELLPWLDLGATAWRTLKVDRAEPRQHFRSRVRHAFVGRVEGVENAVVGWPNKLCLCPDLGERLQYHLHEHRIRPRDTGDLALLDGLGRPPIAPPCWAALFE